VVAHVGAGDQGLDLLLPPPRTPRRAAAAGEDCCARLFLGVAPTPIPAPCVGGLAHPTLSDAVGWFCRHPTFSQNARASVGRPLCGRQRRRCYTRPVEPAVITIFVTAILIAIAIAIRSAVKR
jgi:hypothetical protein